MSIELIPLCQVLESRARLGVRSKGAARSGDSMLEEITSEIWFYVVAGFVAQVIDGAMGMAYGVTASSLLIGFGVPPAITSATVHAAECFTTGTSGLSHHYFGNVDRRLFRTLIIPGVLGAV